jgi:hypothetical protein
LSRRFAKLPRMGKVYVDPALFNIVLPYNKRGDSATTVPIVKGSKYALDAKEIVRLFVHWTGNIDVDLSVICYGNDFNYVTQISWTRPRDFNCVHSGDIQNAPHGASEFIDFDIPNFRKNGIRYVAAWVISYRGQTFDTFPCFAGFMERDSLKSGKKYEPESVKLKFDLKGEVTSYMPLIFDLDRQQVVFADLGSGNGQHRFVGSGDEKFVVSMKALLDMTNTKPTVADVLYAHVTARGSLVSSPKDADLIFTAADIDVDKIAQEYTA